MNKQNTSSKQSGTKQIAQNKKAFHNYFIENSFEAGMVLLGWEVKSLREGRAQLVDSHIIVKNAELFLLGMNITPLKTVSTHFDPESTRTRKLLLHKNQIEELIGSVERKGYTLIPLKLYFKNGKVKIEIGLAKGKKQHDKRDAEKTRDWKREQERMLKTR
jgi:SsrA-binding protein